MSPLTEPTRIILRNGWQPMDPDAAAYITAVETADGQALEEKVKIAIDNFVLGCKADGIWDAIKASCILAGARTLNGALVPLAGAAPTNFNFVSGDYNRKTGLVGDGSTKYLNSNRNNNADPQNNKHIAAFSTFEAAGLNYALMGSLMRSPFLSVSQIYRTSGGINTDTQMLIPSMVNFVGISRSNGSSQTVRSGGATTTQASVSNASHSLKTFVFARNDSGSVLTYATARLAFYSIGEFLDLALLDARVTDLINKFAEVIP